MPLMDELPPRTFPLRDAIWLVIHTKLAIMENRTYCVMVKFVPGVP